MLTLLCVYNTNGNDLIEEASDSQSVDLMINETEKRGDREAGSRLLYLDCIKAVWGEEDLFSITSG